MALLLIKNATQIIQFSQKGQRLFRTEESFKDAIIAQQNFSLLVNEHGLISWIGSASQMDAELQKRGVFPAIEIDASGLIVLPGFVDASAQPVWYGNGLNETIMKLRGKTYLEIQRAGCGLENVRSETSNASFDDLLSSAKTRADYILQNGTTLMGARAGLAHDIPGEIRLLHVITTLNKSGLVEFVPICVADHEPSVNRKPEDAASFISHELLPAVVSAQQQGTIQVHGMEVHCEVGTYDYSSSKAILQAAKVSKLSLYIRSDASAPSKAMELTNDFNILSIVGLENFVSTNLGTMFTRSHGVISVVQPLVSALGKKIPAPVHRLLEGGLPIAIGTGYGPRNSCCSMLSAISLACTQMHLSPAQALIASTLHSAASLGLSDRYGSIELGKEADLVLIAAPSWEYIALGFSATPIVLVAKKGRIILDKRDKSSQVS